jgi:DNA-binding response OmpR family regulator
MNLDKDAIVVTKFPRNICIIDDDEDFVRFLAEYLGVRKSRCTTFGSAESMLKSGTLPNYDFFIIDLGLPGIDGVDLTSLVRGQSSAGILITSGRLGPDAFNSALAAGADMFVNKPVRFDQVYHAVESIWRRLGSAPTPQRGQWRINRSGSTLTSPQGKAVDLTAIEARLVMLLREAAPHAVTRSHLAQAAGIAPSPDDRNLDAALFRLRRKVEKLAGCASPFRTVHGVGYQISEASLIDES